MIVYPSSVAPRLKPVTLCGGAAVPIAVPAWEIQFHGDATLRQQDVGRHMLIPVEVTGDANRVGVLDSR